MGESTTRPRRRDAVFVAALAAVLVAGLIHFGLQMSDEQAAGEESTSEPRSPAQPQARLGSGETADPSQAPATAGTCWDGRATSSMALCGLPEGVPGLVWVFPSFSPDRASCHPTPVSVPGYDVVQSFECFEWALGEPVTVTYDQVPDQARAEAWLEQVVRLRNRTELPGAHGGRVILADGRGRPARITGLYARFPYVVSVFAPNRKVAERAWKALVRMRPPQAVRGTAAG